MFMTFWIIEVEKILNDCIWKAYASWLKLAKMRIDIPDDSWKLFDKFCEVVYVTLNLVIVIFKKVYILVLYYAMSRFFPVFWPGTHSLRLADRSKSKAHFLEVVSVLDGISIAGPLLPPDVKELCWDVYWVTWKIIKIFLRLSWRSSTLKFSGVRNISFSNGRLLFMADDSAHILSTSCVSNSMSQSYHITRTK